MNLRQVVDGDVRLVRVERQVVLMVCLGPIELLARLDGCDDRGRKKLRRVELRDIGCRYPTLLGILREDGRAILRTDIGTLAIELGWVVHHGEIDLKDAAVGDAMRVEG